MTTPPYRKHYDERRAADYAHAKEAAAATHRAEVALVERALRAVPRGQSVLDLPCGAARMTVELARMGFTRLAGADVSRPMAALARERLLAEGIAAPIFVADSERLCFADGAFDNVFCFRLLHHFPTQALCAQVVRELCRVARRRVVISYLDRRSFAARRRQLYRMLRPRKQSKFTLLPGEAAVLVVAAGFRPVADLARLPFVHSLRLLVAERS